MKGLLAGRWIGTINSIPRDGRKKYPIYQGEEWRRNIDFVDRIRRIAEDAASRRSGRLNCDPSPRNRLMHSQGAKRAYQIRDNAGAMGGDSQANTLRSLTCDRTTGPVTTAPPYDQAKTAEPRPALPPSFHDAESRTVERPRFSARRAGDHHSLSTGVVFSYLRAEEADARTPAYQMLYQEKSARTSNFRRPSRHSV